MAWYDKIAKDPNAATNELSDWRGISSDDLAKQHAKIRSALRDGGPHLSLNELIGLGAKKHSLSSDSLLHLEGCEFCVSLAKAISPDAINSGRVRIEETLREHFKIPATVQHVAPAQHAVSAAPRQSFAYVPAMAGVGAIAAVGLFSVMYLNSYQEEAIVADALPVSPFEPAPDGVQVYHTGTSIDLDEEPSPAESADEGLINIMPRERLNAAWPALVAASRSANVSSSADSPTIVYDPQEIEAVISRAASYNRANVSTWKVLSTASGPSGFDIVQIGRVIDTQWLSPASPESELNPVAVIGVGDTVNLRSMYSSIGATNDNPSQVDGAYLAEELPEIRAFVDREERIQEGQEVMLFDETSEDLRTSISEALPLDVQ